MRKLVSRISPLTVVCAIAIMVIASSAIANYFLGNHSRAIDPRVTMETSNDDKQLTKEIDVRRKVIIAATDGEVARTADRVGEAEALALATTLYAANEQLKGRTPRTAGALLAGVVTESLLPPGLTITDEEGALTSDHSNLFVRYRIAPLGVEVISLGRELRDGPAILVRVSDENAKEGGACLFLANRLSDVSVPPAFTPAANIIIAGWSPEPFRSLK